MTKRLRGKAGQQARARRLQRCPICAHCALRGIVKATDQIDHIVPLAFGGLDVDENTQGLCLVCHAVKTGSEGSAVAGAAGHPTWLQPALGELLIVAGPPLSGKSGIATERAGNDGLLIDQSQIMARLSPSYRPWSGTMDPELFNRSLRVRNTLLAGLSRPPARRAVLVVSAPSKEERDWWLDLLGGEILLLDPGLEESLDRARKLRAVTAIPAIKRWYDARYQRWQGLPRRRPAKVAFGEDGYPLGSKLVIDPRI